MYGHGRNKSISDIIPYAHLYPKPSSICCSAKKEPCLPLKYSRAASRRFRAVRMKCPFNGKICGRVKSIQKRMPGPWEAYGADQVREARSIHNGNREARINEATHEFYIPPTNSLQRLW